MEFGKEADELGKKWSRGKKQLKGYRNGVLFVTV